MRFDYNENGYSGEPAITVDKDDNVYVVFVDDRVANQEEIYYTMYDCSEWTAPEMITLNSGFYGGLYPQLGLSIVTDSKGYICVLD